MMQQKQESGQHEESIEIPLERIDSGTLRKMVEEFVTREWSELTDADVSLDAKVDQVLSQLHNGQARVVYDALSQSCNLVPCR